MATGPATRTGDGRFELIADGPFCWRLEPSGDMRVPGLVFASERMLPDLLSDRALEQVANVATLPGIVQASYAMPDIHLGYGFPIGGVAATDLERGGVVSPGGVGFDISCGVRLLVADLDRDDVAPKVDRLMDALNAAVPKGTGKGGVWDLKSQDELTHLMLEGARFAVQRGFGTDRDLDRCEDGGALPDADPDQVSTGARARGLGQVGSLGSGNHFLEVQAVDSIFDETVAGVFGLWPGQICVMIHCGSRGLGHQVCTDHVKSMDQAMHRYGIRVADRQLACAPVDSPEGRAYLGGMAAATNFGRANRQLLSEAARDAFAIALGTRDLRLLYDVSHNLAKLERHVVDGEERLLCVQRKGATLALPPGHPGLSKDLRPAGQPVLIPGSMGTASYVAEGLGNAESFETCQHGAGRALSRTAARKAKTSKDVYAEMASLGVALHSGDPKTVAEEAAFAYKDIEVVMAASASLVRPTKRLTPLGVVKG